MSKPSWSWIWVGVVLAAISLIAGGCGSDEGNGSADQGAAPAEPAAPTKKEYIASADRICKQAAARGSALVADLNKALDGLGAATTADAQSAAATAVADRLGKVADVRDAVGKDLKALDAPEEGAADKYLSSRERNTKGLRDEAKAYQAFANSPSQETSDAATAAAEKDDTLRDEAQKLAEDYGFKTCGQPVK